MSLAWRVRGLLPPGGRRAARRVADVVLAPAGSLVAAARPSRTVALTFDDGPAPDVTPQVLDMLERHRATATFFMLTEHARNHPELVREVVAHGHEIALHGDHHDRFSVVAPRQVRARLEAAKRELETIAGTRVRLFRPPFGAQTIRTYLATRSAGLDVVVWGPYAAEWEGGEPSDVADRAMATLAGGEVLLLHDGLEIPDGDPVPTVDRAAAFELVLDRMAGAGLEGVSVSALVAAGGGRRTAWFRP